MLLENPEEHFRSILSKIGRYCCIDTDVLIGKNTIVNNYVELRRGVRIGTDCYIDSGVCMTGDAIIGNHVTIRNQSVIARGCEIGDNTFISPHVMFNNLNTDKQKIGGAKVGKNCFIGTGSVIHHGISICDGVSIGANSFVNRDITEPGVYVGNPVKKIR